MNKDGEGRRKENILRKSKSNVVCVGLYSAMSVVVHAVLWGDGEKGVLHFIDAVPIAKTMRASAFILHLWNGQGAMGGGEEKAERRRIRGEVTMKRKRKDHLMKSIFNGVKVIGIGGEE